MQRSNDNQNQSIEEMKRTTALLGQRVNQLERLLDQKSINEAKVESGAVYQRESRMSLSNGMMRPNWQTTSVAGSGATVMDYSDFAFGFSISGAVVTVNGGYLFHGMRTAIVVEAGWGIGTKTITADHTYFYVNYVFGSGSATIETQVGSLPVHTATTLKYLLYKARLSNGVATISAGDIHHLGSITISGSFA